MNRMTISGPGLWRTCVSLVFALTVALPAAAQSVTASAIQRLQDQVYDAGNEVSHMRSGSDSGSSLQSELDNLRDEVIYLKVKLRKEGNVSRSEYNDVQNRIQDLRARAPLRPRGPHRLDSPAAPPRDSGE